MIVARDIITAARDRSPAFNPQAHPDALALRFLSSYQQDLAGKIALANPEAVAATAVFAYPFQDEEGEPIAFDIGPELPPHKAVQGATLHYRAGGQSGSTALHIIPWESWESPAFPISAWIEDGRLRLVGEKSNWRRAERIEVRYIPETEQLERPTDTLALPDGSRRAVVDALAAFFGSRVGVDLTGLAESSEARYLEEVRRSRRARRIRRRRLQR